MSRTTPIIALNLIILAALGYLIVQQRAEVGAVAAQRARAAASAQRAAAFEAEHRYVEAQLAFERATRLGAGLPEAEGWLEAARRSLARSMLAQANAPAASQRAMVEGLAGALRAEGAEALASALEIAALRGAGQIEAAEARVKAALAQPGEGPDQVWLRWQRGTLQLHFKRNKAAVEDLEAVVKALPAFGAGFHRLGLAYLASDQAHAGIEALKRAVTHNGGAVASLDLAKAFLSQEMWAEATAHLNTVVRANPGHAEALRLLAAAYYQINRFKLAAQTYRKAYQIEPSARTLISAVIALQGAQAWAEALAIVDEVLPQLNRFPEIGFHRGTLLEKLGRKALAKAAFEQYLAAAAGHPDEVKRVKAARAWLLGSGPAHAPQVERQPANGVDHVHPPRAPLPEGHRHGAGGHTHQ
jgi:tetratricopeptide (TPR) repeat protein